MGNMSDVEARFTFGFTFGFRLGCMHGLESGVDQWAQVELYFIAR